MAEDPEREARRSSLTKLRVRLVGALEWLSAARVGDDGEDLDSDTCSTMRHGCVEDDEEEF